MSKRHALTDEQWDRIRNLAPGKDGDPGRTGKNNRLFVDAVLYVLKTGVPWRDLPVQFGIWNSVWRRFDRWCENGIWEKIVKELSDLDLEKVHIESTSIKVHLVAIVGRHEEDEKKKMQIVDEVWAVLAGVWAVLAGVEIPRLTRQWPLTGCWERCS